MKGLSKVDIGLIIFAALVMVAIYFIYPYTYFGKLSYEEGRQNAINYISATMDYMRYSTPNDIENYQAEINRLIKKYNLQDMFPEDKPYRNPLEDLLNENR